VSKLLAITVHDLREVFSNRGIWINLVVIPIALVFLIGVVNGGFNQGNGDGPQLSRTRIDVLNEDDGDLSTTFVTALQAEPTLRVCTPEDADTDGCRLDGETLDEALAVQRIDNNISRALVVVPAGFSESALAGDMPSVIYRANSDIQQVDRALTAVEAVLNRVGGALVAAEVGLHVADDLGEVIFEGYEDQPYAALTFANEEDRAAFREGVYQRAVELWANDPVTVDFAFADNTGTTSPGDLDLIGFRQSVPGMGSMYVMFTVLAGMVTLIQERKQWTLQRLGVMPVARWQILGGKMLARFSMGMIQYAVVFAVGALIGLRYNNLPALLLIMIGFAALMTALTFLLATVVQTENQAGSLSLFLALTLAPLGGAWWPLEIVPSWMQTAGMISPMGWAMRGFTDLLIYERGFDAVVLPIGVLFAATAVVFVGAVARFRYD
jgi:ABC-type multidrug transport system permease subunit